MKKFAKRLLVCAMIISLANTGILPQVQKNNSKVCVQAAAKKISKKQAYKKIKKYLKNHNNWNSNYILSYDHKEGNSYVFHYFENMEDHTATVNWYYINTKTKKIKAMF